MRKASILVDRAWEIDAARCRQLARRTMLTRCSQVNIPKTRKTFCKGKDCRKHTQHKVTQYKAGKVRPRTAG